MKNLPDIIVRAAGRQPFGVMIARGDLAVAIGFERLAEMQEEILWLCESAHVPVIWATQVLEEMVKSGLPTRGEMTDAAMAGRAECVMLNKGPNVGEAITALRGLLQRMTGASVEEDSAPAGVAVLVGARPAAPRTLARGPDPCGQSRASFSRQAMIRQHTVAQIGDCAPYAETPSAKRHLRSAEIGQFLGLEYPCRNQSFSAWNNDCRAGAEYRSGRWARRSGLQSICG